MSRRIRRGDDTGAYAILYGLLLLVVLGMAALVIDLGMLRQNRRETRLAADAAAVAGARELAAVSGAGNPRQACVEALSYLSTNLGVTFPSAPCDVFPVSSDPCPGTQEPALSQVSDFRALITWPVRDDAAMMTDPDVTTGEAAVATQEINPEVDGTDPCARIGVSVEQAEGAAFAGAFGSDGTSTVVTSVARATVNPGTAGPIAALNVLEDNECQAILTGGQATIEIETVNGEPGVIAVESSGRHNAAGECPNSTPWVIDVAEASSGGHVWANGATGSGLGTILSYALNTAPTGNPGDAFNPDTVGAANLLAPTPTVMVERFGTAPVTDVYDCKGTCPYDHTQYVTELKTAIGTGNSVPNPYAGAAPPYDTQTFQTVSATTVPGWPGCTIGTTAVVLVPAGNWYVSCPTLRVQGILVFAGGTVVTRGGINVAGGCFAMNVPIAGVASCPTTTVTGEVVPAPTSEAILYLRGGIFEKNSQGSLFTARTFVHMASGAIEFGGGGGGTLYLTNPQPDTATCDEECQAARFAKAALWNESSSEQKMGGAAGITLRGVLFVPNALFSYTGQGVQVQTNAQFWTRKIQMTGQGTLKMAPDPSRSFPRPEAGTVLIR